MDPLRKVEDILGYVECWPTYLIYGIFLVEPNRVMWRMFLLLWTATVFPSKNCRLFNACIGLQSFYVSCALRICIPYWIKILKLLKARYYSTTLKRWMCINGNALSQQEAACPEVGVTQFGTENPGCQQLRRATIEHIVLAQVVKQIGAIKFGIESHKWQRLESCSLEPDVHTL